MEHRPILIRLLLMLLCLPMAACIEEVDTSPTAIILDNATGQPIEGAVALAQWFSAGGGGLFERGVGVLDKAAEAFSDKDGKVYIKDFWPKRMFSGTTRLTVYKPGYVLWDSRRMCPKWERQTGFDGKNRAVKLLDFDTEAPKWVEKYSKEGLGPREMQSMFFNQCYDGALDSKYPNSEIKFQRIFHAYEFPFLVNERTEKTDKERMEKTKKSGIGIKMTR